jgi:DNA excision repair protein ERCC-3
MSDAHDDTHKPLIIQSDRTILLDVHAPGADEARRGIGPFAELEKSPEHLHTYRITPLSLWNAAAAGLRPDDIGATLERWSRFRLPGHFVPSIRDTMARFGLLKLWATPHPDWLLLVVLNARVGLELANHKKLGDWLFEQEPAAVREALAALGDGTGAAPAVPASTPAPAVPAGARCFWVRLEHRGTVKQELIRLGWPVQDEVPLRQGDPLKFGLTKGATGSFGLRPYQAEAVESFIGDDRPGMGYGTVVLPCGAGKTVVGIGAMHRLQTKTLILTTNVAAVHQWIRELSDKTDIPPEDIGEYSGDNKEIKPVTVATYQILVWRADKESDFPHFGLFRRQNWGLLIYDEVHLLPAPVFRVTAEVQALHRLGLTATLVREDGLETDVFSLVGPKRYDVPWKDMEAMGWIATAWCHELRVDLPDHLSVPYAVAAPKEKYRIAAENPLKDEIVEALVARHPDDHILVIGQYIEQLEKLAARLNAPLIMGKTPNKERDRLYQAFRAGEIRVIVVSKVANFAIDLPDASVAIQVSGSYGSRQEEAQRLGRILRPKSRDSHFFTIVSRFTSEEEFSANRQKFLTEQGYRYLVELPEDDGSLPGLPVPVEPARAGWEG